MASQARGPAGIGNILFLGKRFYTNKDALQERFGRIFHLPMEWARLDRAPSPSWLGRDDIAPITKPRELRELLDRAP